jgi:hypothetical protein
MHTPILKPSPFLNELSQKAADWPDLFIFSSSFRIYLIRFIYVQQESCNCIGNRQTVKASTLFFSNCMGLQLAKLCASVLNIAKPVVKWILYCSFVGKMSRWRSERHLVAFFRYNLKAFLILKPIADFLAAIL